MIRKNGFTLIELLVVIAIIATLFAIGIPLFIDYLKNARIQASISSHQNMVSYVSNKFHQCTLGGERIVFGQPQINLPGGSWPEYWVNCFNQGAYGWQGWIGYNLRDHFGARNAYFPDEPMYRSAGSSPIECSNQDSFYSLKLGEAKFGTGNPGGASKELCLVTNIGDPDGKDAYQIDYIALPDQL